MANYTEKAIIQIFEKMLEEMPFEKITVTALVKRCEISSNTFYYHFKDIYDILEKWLMVKRNEHRVNMKDMEWPDRLKMIFKEMKANPKIVFHITDSISSKRWEQFMFGALQDMFVEAVKKLTVGKEISDDEMNEVASFYCYAVSGVFQKYLWERMEMDIDTTVDRLHKVFYGVLEYVLRRGLDGAYDEI